MQISIWARKFLGIPPGRQPNYIIMGWIGFLHLMSIVSLIHLGSYPWYTIVEVWFLWQIYGLGITAGAHRLWAHRSYQASYPLQIFLMLLNSGSMQHNVIWWALDHRPHHKHSDKEADPHDSSLGFAYSHWGWIFCNKTELTKKEGDLIEIKDLTDNPILSFQKKMPFPWYAFWGLGVPTLLGGLRWSNYMDGFLIYGCLRLTLSLHATWCINSVSHLYGSRPYSNIPPANNFFTSLFAVGEGWHNYHHAYPKDYRTAELPWYIQINLTTLFIDTMVGLGLASRTLSMRHPQRKNEQQPNFPELSEKEYESLWKKIQIVFSESPTKPNTLVSLGCLFQSVSLVFAFGATSYLLVSFYPEIKFWYWPLYSCVMGTLAIGLWVLGHECGHGSFSESSLLNQLVGVTVHSFLLVPFYSWKFAHAKHHRYTNHLIKGETHVPSTRKGFEKMFQSIYRVIGEDGFAILQIIEFLTVGWPAYLLINASGGRSQSDNQTPLDHRRPKDHFRPSSQIFPEKLKNQVWWSSFWILTVIASLVAVDWKYGFGTVAYWHGGAYLVTNFWLVTYTYLQHTHPEVPHYGNDHFTWLKGALSTIDRPYGKVISWLHHHIGTSHVVHHLNYRIPHYHAIALTPPIRKILSSYGLVRYDERPIWEALYSALKTCHYVESLSGTQKYHKYQPPNVDLLKKTS